MPIVEMLVIIETGRRFGFWFTLGALIVLGLLGLYLVKKQGFAVITKIKYEISLGHVPTDSLLDGLLILVSGLLLLTPGLITDLLGLLLLIDPLRIILRRKFIKYITKILLPGHLLKIKW